MEALFLLDGLKINSIYVCEEDNIELITVELPGVVLHSVYKPPAEQFQLPPLGSRNMPHIVISDFNSYNTLCGYTSTDDDGEANNLSINNKQQSTTHGNAPKGSGSYLRPKTHIQHTHPQHLSTSTQTSTNHKSTHCNRMG